jgi:hypothetical protein
MMEELGIGGIPAAAPMETAVTFAPFGRPVEPEEVAVRLSQNLYDQLSEKSDDTVREAITRAGIYIGAVLRRLNAPYNLDNDIVREVVLIHAIYELHIALGHEEAGREYRLKAKDIILAAWGDFPDSEDKHPPRTAAAAVAVPAKRRGGWQWT